VAMGLLAWELGTVLYTRGAWAALGVTHAPAPLGDL